MRSVGQLAERVAAGTIPLSAGSVIQAEHVRGADPVRSWDEVARRAASMHGPVRTSIDLGAFTWIGRSLPARPDKDQPRVRLTATMLTLYGLQEAVRDGWTHFQVGILSRAIAIRRASAKEGWYLAQGKSSAKRVIYRLKMPGRLMEAVQRHGWQLPVDIVLTWYPDVQAYAGQLDLDARGRAKV